MPQKYLFTKKLILGLIASVMVGSLVLTTGCNRLKKAKAKISALFSEKEAAKVSSNAKESKNLVWSYFQVRKATIADAIEADGKLESSERIEIRADKRMRVSPAKFKVADHVKRGDVLFVVDTKEFEQKRIESKERVAQLTVDIKAAKSQFSFAAKQTERKKGLVSKGIAAQKELDEAQKAYITADTDVKTKELELRKAERELVSANETVTSANVISPIDGIVASIATGGDEINQGESLAVVANPAQLALVVTVDETEVTKLKPAQKVQVIVEALPKKVIAATVKSVETNISQGAIMNTYSVFLTIAPDVVKSLALKDGFAAKMRAVFGEKEMALIVPRSCVKQNGSDTYLMVASAMGGVPVARSVKLGVQTDLEVEIIKGVNEGEFAAVASDQEGASQ